MRRTVRCPCCQAPTLPDPKRAPLSQEMELADAGLTPWWAKPGWSIRQDRRNNVRWACEDCLRSGRAIVANPARQLYCDWSPYLAYFDKSGVCTKCGSEFIFPKEEQRYWYEELGFWVQSYPKE